MDQSSEWPVLELRGLRRSYGKKNVVEDIDLALKDGEFFSLIGPSGCGKTTTLRMIAGFENSTSGTIMLEGRDVTAIPAYNRNVHTVFQNYALFPHLTVAENIAFGLKEKHGKGRDVRDKVQHMLKLVELAGREHARPRELSGGMQQRVALARALVLDPAVLLLDEPLGALDLRLRRQMQLLLKQIQHEVGITFVYVTHDQEEAFAMSDRVGVMDQGVLVQVGTPRDVYGRPATPFVADFVGARNQLTAKVIAQESDTADVDIPLFGRRRAPAADGLGSDAMVIIRPEVATLTRSGTGAKFTVEDVSFQGPQTSVLVQGGGGVSLTLVQPSHTIPAGLTRGEQVAVDIAGEDLWVIPTL
ncbi:MAG: spermidine/putrescine transport system ATP-binding protein [Mycobacterium sp.]|nr:spermidine/putrescine transport system ATP-binding protein [Mycobacterium sp.]